MFGISILADFRPMGYKLSCCGSLWSSDLLLKSVLGHCLMRYLMGLVFKTHNIIINANNGN